VASAILRVRRSKQVYRSRIPFWTGRQQSARFGAVPPPARFVSGKTGAPAPGVSTFNARGDGVEQAHVAGWPSRDIPGPAKVESSPAAMATDSSRGKDPVDLV
jgi:hypothetical protein